MRELMIGALVAVLAATAFGQDANIHDVKFKYDKALRRISGVQDVTVAGTDGVMKIVARVDSADTRETVLKLCGEKLDGYPLHVIVSGGTSASPTASQPATATSACANCACPCHRRPGQTVAENRKPEPKFDLDKINDQNYAVEQCDMLREVLGLSKRPAANGVRCQQMVGWTNDPKKIEWVEKNGLPHWRSKDMPGIPGSGTEIICYTYVKHRQFCPMGMKQLLKDLDGLTPK